MPAPAVQNRPAPIDSKSGKKKKAKGERTESPAPATANSDKAPSVAANEATSDETSDNPYIRELSKNVRNLSKKLANASRTDTVIAENKGKSLDELVALKVINADQKAQQLKKPALQGQLSQAEEQLAQFKKIDQEYRTRAAADKSALENSLTEKYEKEKADAINEVKEKATADSKKAMEDSLLILSQFLRLAAARRAEESNAEADENLALEGVLLAVYSGDENGVATMMKLVEGSEDQTKSVANEVLGTTFAQVKAASIAHSVPLFQPEADQEPSELPAESNAEPETDPTVAHASLTEIEAGVDTALTNGHVEESPSSAHPNNADVADGAANAAAESQWDTANPMSMSQEWVEVPRDPAETDTGLNATPAAATNTQSWADDQPDAPAEAATPTDANEGFHQVQRNRGNRESTWRGNRGNYRGGRGFRGDRGRGGRGGRGGNAPFRGGPRRTDNES